MKIELRNVKHAAFASQETPCFSAAVFIDGKKAGEASNQGHGGPNHIQPRSLEDALTAHAATLPDVATDYEIDGKPFSLRPTADYLISEAFTDWATERDLSRLLKGKLVFIKGGKILATKKIDPATLKVLLADGDNLRQRHGADVVLNALPFAEALDLYRKHFG